MKRYILIFLMVFLPFVVEARKSASRVPIWVSAMTKGSVKVNAERDYSLVISYNSPGFIGYIGCDYRKMEVCITSVRRINNLLYGVDGYTRVKGNTCSFRGSLKIIEARVFKNPGYGVDNEMKGKFDKRGCCVALFELNEERRVRDSGMFRGYSLFFWYTGTGGRLHVDDIDSYADGYCNNLFSGTWTSFRTHRTKPCGWGLYRIPNCGDLDIGAAEFSVNPKYRNNGWR